MLRTGAGLLLTAAALPLMAQQKPFDYYSSAELHQKIQQAMTKAVATPAGSAGDKISTYDDHQITIGARIKSGAPEVHQHWTDVIIVTEGEATMIIGGTVVNPVPHGAADSGELGGSDITGGTTQVLKKGDIVNIPAGTPHWIKIAPGEKFSYMNVKVKK